MNLSTKQEQSLDIESKLNCYQGINGGGINWKIGINI